MAQEIEFQGEVLEFPDEATDEQIKGYLRKRVGKPEAPKEKEFKSVEPTIMQGVSDFFTDVWAEMKSSGGLSRDAFETATGFKQYTPEYDANGQLINVRKESDEEFASRKKVAYQTRRFRHRAPEEGSAASITGQIASEIIDPSALILGSKAFEAGNIFARVMKISAAGSTYEAAATSLDQKVKDGEIKDAEEVATRAVLGGVATPLVAESLRIAGKVYQKSRSGKLLDKMESLFEDKRAKGLNKKAAWDQTRAELGLNDDTVRVIEERAGRKVVLSRKLPDKKNISDSGIAKLANKAAKDIDNGVVAKAMKEEFVTGVSKPRGYVSSMLGDFKDGLDNIFGVLSTRIKKISEPVYYQLRKYDIGTHQRTHESLSRVQGFLRAMDSLRGNDRKLFKKIVYNGDTEALNKFMATPGRESLKEGFAAWNTLRGELFQELKDAGHNIHRVEEFFPRVVSDHKGLAKHLGLRTGTPIERYLLEAEAKKGSPLTGIEKSEAINKALRTPREAGKGRSSTLKSRTLHDLDDASLAFYAEPADAMTQYVSHVVNNLEKRKFFGHGRKTLPKYGENLENSIGALIGRELDNKNITVDQAESLRQMLRARFGAGESAPKGWMQDIKNVFYAATLANPVSAATQLGDLGIAAYVQGLGNTTRSVLRKWAIDMEDIGLDLVTEEMASTRKTARMLDKLLRYRIGGVIPAFKDVDRFGKNTVINASLIKHRALARTEKGVKKLEEKYRNAFTPQELGSVIENLKRGDVIDNNIKFILWNELADVQPISLSELPKWYLDHPQGRILYMLNSFTIKQLDIIRRDAVQAMKRGEVKGATNLMRFGALFTLANMSADKVKNWMQGKDQPIEDMVVSNIWKNFAMSEFLVEKIKSGKVSEALASQFLTPFTIAGNIVQDVYGDLAEAGTRFKSLRHVPVAGKLMYMWFGGGIEAFEEMQQKKKKEEFKEKFKLEGVKP